MKEQEIEIAQRINDAYVSDDCVQVMIPYLGDSITVLNGEEIVYHYKENSHYYENNYINDERRHQFPYSNIPVHFQKIGNKKVKCVNQLLDYNKMYIEISDGTVKENYVVRDGEKAIIIRKLLIPNLKSTEYFSHDEVSKFLDDKEDVAFFDLDGGYIEHYSMPTKKEILDYYKNRLEKKLEAEEHYMYQTGHDFPNYENFARKYIDSLTLQDIPVNEEIIINNDLIMISYQENEISSIKSFRISFVSEDCYKVDIYSFPITKYTLGQIKEIAQGKLSKISEPIIRTSINPAVDKNEIKKSKQLVKNINKQNKKHNY